MIPAAVTDYLATCPALMLKARWVPSSKAWAACIVEQTRIPGVYATHAYGMGATLTEAFSALEPDLAMITRA